MDWEGCDRRRELRILDRCLGQLEDAQERGESILSADLATSVSEVVGPLVPGMSIVDAIEVVFDEQERHMGRPRSSGQEHRLSPSWERQEQQATRTEQQQRIRTEEASVPMNQNGMDVTAAIGSLVSGGLGTPDCEPISLAEARLLTERIRTATRHVCLLLREVHERRAWVPLGYANWEQYVQSEFSISRSRSYELLDQANVMLELRSTAGMRELPDVSAYVALQIKPRLAQIKEALREQVRASNGENVVEIVAKVVDEHRRQVAQSRRFVQERRALRRLHDDPERRDDFSEAIDVLASIASARRVEDVVMKAAEPPQIANVEAAIEWLNHLLAELKRTQRTPTGSGAPRSMGR